MVESWEQKNRCEKIECKKMQAMLKSSSEKLSLSVPVYR